MLSGQIVALMIRVRFPIDTPRARYGTDALTSIGTNGCEEDGNPLALGARQTEFDSRVPDVIYNRG